MMLSRTCVGCRRSRSTRSRSSATSIGSPDRRFLSGVPRSVIGDMTSYIHEQRKCASRWKQETSTLPAAAKVAAPYVDTDGKPGQTPYPFCLPVEYADHNLLPDVRDEAVALFAELGIPWHAGVGEGPSNHLLSS